MSVVVLDECVCIGAVICVKPSEPGAELVPLGNTILLRIVAEPRQGLRYVDSRGISVLDHGKHLPVEALKVQRDHREFEEREAALVPDILGRRPELRPRRGNQCAVMKLRTG